ncbi:O-antigen ligase family protein [Roseateles oligotrophus]|uniref:O-antigen ligase-related domain-containing protein n=1 Tax=Roseateles oligotrophus TaxID=1769250 RepID=A0ABT2YDZ8_9BURK|nr:O-antigen ligase family protein [Roseateles oligotrophus]MCV2368254.1 hypothetical protein [Roseateles oligotrophus]
MHDCPRREKKHLTTALAVLVFIDLLFLPRLLFAFGIPISLLIIIGSLVRERLRWRGVICWSALSATMFFCVTYGTIFDSIFMPNESLKRVFQLLTILLFFFYRVDLPMIRPKLVKVLRAFYIWVFFAMLLFFWDSGLYTKIATFIYPEMQNQLEDAISTLRFAYCFSDPNTAGFFLCFTLVAYLSIERNIRWTFFCATLATITVVATQSRGAFLALLLIFSFLMYGSPAPQGKKVRIILFIGLFVGLLAILFSEEISAAYAVFEGRFEQEDELGGGRAGKYAYFLQNLNLLPFGSGYHLQRAGSEFRPHSDLIRLNLAYGVFALPMILYFVYPRRRTQVLLFGVFLIPFLINTVIDDYRLFPMYLLLFTLLGQIDTARTKTSQRNSLNTYPMARKLTS